jgi:type 1 fimbria pilin
VDGFREIQMRKMISIVAGAAFAAALAMPVLAADMTVKGEVVDVACSTKKGEGGKGDAHAGCAMACAKKGLPVGILTADAVYTVVGDYAANSNAKLLDFVARKVIVTGEVTEKDGVKSINVKSIKLAN